VTVSRTWLLIGALVLAGVIARVVVLTTGGGGGGSPGY
jgi:hypothetical protein